MFCLVLILALAGYSNAWNGIILSGLSGPQMYFPTTAPHSIANNLLGLPSDRSLAANQIWNQVYFTGGATTNVYSFNLWTNTTHMGTPMKYARQFHASCVYSHSLVVCGGVLSNTCEQFDMNTKGPWTLLPSLPQRTINHKMAELDGNLYLFGGSDNVVDLANVFMLNGTAWVPRTPIPKALNVLGLVGLTNRALICGGTTGHTTWSTCFVYTAKTNLWASAPSMAQARSGHSMVLLENQIYIMGGFAPNGSLLSSVEVYSMTSGGQVLPYPMAKGDAMFGAFGVLPS